ncbi:hypothetical protein ACG04R_16515 [Roseateles sp. BYS78W]|uniref:Trimeric autotransporter adhesin YadA-like C-terminal membrane anchor domain-containing protein n=1 Tax=Pelomonas candidula TaxID=3299025 RepID=A0ABW7HEP0_9BURK
MKLNRISIAAALAIAAGAAGAQTVAPILTVGPSGDPASTATSVTLTSSGTQVQSNVAGVGQGSLLLGLYTSSPGAGNLVAGTGAMSLPGVNYGAAIGNGSIVDRSNTVSFGIGNGLGYLPNYRILANVGAGQLATDAVNLGQAQQLSAQAVTTANAYTDSSLSGVNATLANHDARITSAQATADTATATAQGADNKATTALSQSGQALAIAQQTQQEVVQLTGRVNTIDSRLNTLEDRMNGYDRRIDSGVAMASAMNAAIAPSLAPGESAVVGGLGGFKGQGALALGIVHTNFAGQTFTAKFSTSSAGTAVAVGGAVKF